jgi:aminodeoxyfutalosine deaminase
MHAGEIGGPKEIRDAIEILGVERIGHGIAAFRDPTLMDLLAERKIPLEICPWSNLKTGALGKQLGDIGATLQEHPLPRLLRHGIPVVLSTDDPPMFHTNLLQEYRSCLQMGLTEAELKRMVAAGFEHAFSADKIPPPPML